MSGIISFEDGSYWSLSNSEFEHFMNEVIKDHPGSPDLMQTCRWATIYHGFRIASLREKRGDLANEMLAALERTTERRLAEFSATFPDLGEGEEGDEMLLKQVAHLRELLGHVKSGRK